MAERFQTVFTLPENLYLEGSPVRIASGALLRDSMTGQIFTQLTMQNIGPRSVKSVKVVVRPLDVAGRPMGIPTIFPYLDFIAERGAYIGQQVLIPMADHTTRGISAMLTEIVFADNSVWAAPAGGEWTPMEPQKPLAEALGDPEMVKQYQLRFGEDAEYQPDRIADLWRCTCGAVNRKDENICHACRKVAGALFDPELMQELGKEKDARLEAERIEREAREEEARKKAEEKKAAAEAARKKLVKILRIAVPVLVAVIAAVLIVTKVVIPNSSYNKAVALLEDGKYKEAAAAFDALGDYKDSKEKLTEAETGKAIAEAEALEKDGKLAEAAMAYGALIDADPECRERSFALWDEIAQRSTVVSGLYHTVGINEDGTVTAIGNNEKHQCDVSDWENIIAVDGGAGFTLGLRADGTVVAVGLKDDGRRDVSEWPDVVAICAGAWHSVGLQADGTVVATGANDDSQCEVADWRNIVAIAADQYHTVGLRADGTVVATGDANKYVEGWTDIVAIAAGTHHTVGLRADGTVVATGSNSFEQCDVSSWKNIVAISAKNSLTIGLCADGSVVVAGYLPEGLEAISEWKDIVTVSVGFDHVVGLRSDGSVVAAGMNDNSQCNVEDWTDIKLPNKK